MPFPCNGICSSRGFNLGFSLCSTLRQVSFPIPYFKFFLNGIGNGPALSLIISVNHYLPFPAMISLLVHSINRVLQVEYNTFSTTLIRHINCTIWMGYLCHNSIPVSANKYFHSFIYNSNNLFCVLPIFCLNHFLLKSGDCVYK